MWWNRKPSEEAVEAKKERATVNRRLTKVEGGLKRLTEQHNVLRRRVEEEDK